MIRRIAAWAFMKLADYLKPEVSLWNVSTYGLDEIDPGQHDVITITVDNGRYNLTYDTLVTARARQWMAKNEELLRS